MGAGGAAHHGSAVDPNIGMSLLKFMSDGALVKVDCTLDRKAACA